MVTGSERSRRRGGRRRSCLATLHGPCHGVPGSCLGRCLTRGCFPRACRDSTVHPQTVSASSGEGIPAGQRGGETRDTVWLRVRHQECGIDWTPIRAYGLRSEGWSSSGYTACDLHGYASRGPEDAQRHRMRHRKWLRGGWLRVWATPQTGLHFTGVDCTGYPIRSPLGPDGPRGSMGAFGAAGGQSSRAGGPEEGRPAAACDRHRSELDETGGPGPLSRGVGGPTLGGVGVDWDELL